MKANSKYEQLRNNIFSTNFDPACQVDSVFYGRVSTELDSQKDSCDNQLLLARNFARKHPNVNIVAELVDDGISGKNAIERPDFIKLIELITSRKVQVILTKSLSRLHRDDETSAFLRRLCYEYGVAFLVLESEQFLDPEDESSLMLQSFQSVIDSQYVARQSRYGRITHQLRCEKKELSCKDVCFGFDWHKDTKTITINEEEARVVEYIFNAYLFEQKMPTDIAKELVENGTQNRFSKVNFTAGTINNIIQNEKYAGRFYINKRTTQLGRGFNGKSKRVPLPKEEWVLVDRQDLRIIDEEMFQLAQRLRASRQTTYSSNDFHITRQKFEGKHLFAGKMRCGCCGKPLRFAYADRKETIPIYRINSHKGCENRGNARIKEDTAKEMVSASIKAMLASHSEAIQRVENLLYGNLRLSQNEGELRQIERDLAHFKKEVDKYSLPLTDPDILANKQLKESFLSKVKDAQDHIATLEARKKELSVSMDTSAIEERITHLKQVIGEFKEVKELSRERILRNVKEMVLKEDGSVSIVLTSGLSSSLRSEGLPVSFTKSVDKYQIQDVLIHV